MLVTLPAGRCGRNELDAGTTAHGAPAATGGQGIATVSASDVAASTIAVGNGRRDHSCGDEEETGSEVQAGEKVPVIWPEPWTRLLCEILS